ncbi:bis(5'-nucleosyl)-tetraphosphatase (symmetrical) YqeK, partial [Candidatus Sumerlaeota bacterium]
AKERKIIRMPFPRLDAIYPKLMRRLDSDRYYHSLGTMQVALGMALELRIDPRQAVLAGLLHDCERCEPVERLRLKIERFRLKVPPEELPHTALYHNYVGAYTARVDFGVRDRAVLRAIRRHTCGGERMTRLDKLLYIADLIEPSRGRINENVKVVRSLAFRDLEAAFRLAISEKLNYLRESRIKLNPRAQRMVAAYLN